MFPHVTNLQPYGTSVHSWTLNSKFLLPSFGDTKYMFLLVIMGYMKENRGIANADFKERFLLKSILTTDCC